MESLAQLLTVVAKLARPLFAAKSIAWRYTACPLLKLLWPVRDAQSGIRQSRRRYYRVRVQRLNGSELRVLQEVDSNGQLLRYLDDDGGRIFLLPGEGSSVDHKGAFQHPRWARLDWPDIFNGDSKSGCWGITER